MIAGFQKYLIDNGFVRYREDFHNKKLNLVEDNESMFVSSYGPVSFRFIKDGVLYLYWGLLHKGKSPRFYLPVNNNEEFITTNNFNSDLERLINIV